MNTPSLEQNSHDKMFPRVIAALGVVFGDIGTSPLYALRECFHGPHSIALNENNVLGVLSLVIWSLIIVISIKYFLFILNADNRGEGGILSLLALTSLNKSTTRFSILVTVIGIFGAALLFGDGMLTPSISVLSAVEGLTVAVPLFQPYVLPTTIAILVGLFFMQSRGTARIGMMFGPVIALWFLVLGTLGFFKMLENPHVLMSWNPWYAIRFFMENGWEGFVVLGSVFLVVTGGEALYADMGHFGKRPMKMAWFSLVFPGLILNYLGQGALLLSDPTAIDNPFFKIAPSWALIPLVLLATMATVIASQALISGVFSLTRQAVQLGYAPRINIVHTSRDEIGQIYVPQVNWALMIGCIFIVLEFRTSSALASAYGIAVATTMVITTLLAAVVTQVVWKWNWLGTALVMLVFVPIDFLFFSANIIKLPDGGWFPLSIGAWVYLLMMTWKRGRKILMDWLANETRPLKTFFEEITKNPPHRVDGVAIFMSSDTRGTPPALVHNLEHNKVLHKKVFLLTIITETIPSVSGKNRVQTEVLSHDFYRVIARYGFMETPNIADILNAAKASLQLSFEMKEITFFLGRETLLTCGKGNLAGWRKTIFAYMSRNAQRATAFFQIPSDQVVELGIQVEL